MLWDTARRLISCAGVVALLVACSDSGDDSGDAGEAGPPEAGAVSASGGSGATSGSGGTERDASQSGGGGSGSGGRGGAGGMSAGDAAAGNAGGAGGAAQATDAGSDGGTSGTGGASGTGGGSDAGPVPETVSQHVHIYISNTCDVSVDPVEVTIPREQSVFFTYHNHSVDYEADVWGSYGGGYLGLVPGGTWADPIERCTELATYTAHTDVSIHGLGLNDPYCPGQRMTIHCE